MNSMKSSYQAGVCGGSIGSSDYQSMAAKKEQQETRVGLSLCSLGNSITALNQIVSVLESRLRVVAKGKNEEKCAAKAVLSQESSNIADKIDKATDRVVNINANLNDLLDRLEI